MIKKVIITAILLVYTFQIDAQSWWSNKRVKGNGNVITDIRTTGDFDGISAGGFFDVVLVKGKEGEITIEGEENLLEYIETKVSRGILKIQVEKGINLKTTRTLLITVPIEDIESVSLAGSGNLTSKTIINSNDLQVNLGGSGNIILDISVKNLESSIGGSGNIKLSGEADYMRSSIAGSGTIKAYQLQVNEIKASIAGSGDIRVSVNNEIDASVAGSGSVYYKGSPAKINSKSVGSGSVRSRN